MTTTEGMAATEGTGAGDGARANEGLLVPPGHGRVVRTPAQHVTFK